MARPICLDLFAGAGGLSLGFEQAGFDVVAAIDIDPIHCATHEFNFPRCKTICSDVKHIAGDDIRRIAGIGNKAIDVVCGGAPCQGFSLIGKRALDDPRNNLVYHFMRLILELRPHYFLFENVKGLTIGKHRGFLDEVISAFEEGNHCVVKEYRVLNATDYSVPQDRRRLFLLGAMQGMPLPKHPLPTGRTTVLEALGDLPEVEDFPQLFERDWVRAKFGPPSEYARRLRELSGLQKVLSAIIG